VLDVGSGGVSSVFALAKLLPNAEVIASDISPRLLGKLVAAAARAELRSRVVAYCLVLSIAREFNTGTSGASKEQLCPAVIAISEK
jgi:methylase of polypeptide subunit release factors